MPCCGQLSMTHRAVCAQCARGAWRGVRAVRGKPHSSGGNHCGFQLTPSLKGHRDKLGLCAKTPLKASGPHLSPQEDWAGLYMLNYPHTRNTAWGSAMGSIQDLNNQFSPPSRAIMEPAASASRHHLSWPLRQAFAKFPQALIPSGAQRPREAGSPLSEMSPPPTIYLPRAPILEFLWATSWRFSGIALSPCGGLSPLPNNLLRASVSGRFAFGTRT